MTQIENARKGIVTREVEAAAKAEGLAPEFIMRGVAEGTIALCKNNVHDGIAPLAVGTVPVYQAAVEAAAARGSVVKMTADDMFRVIEEHAAQGVDFMTVHCGVTQESV